MAPQPRSPRRGHASPRFASPPEIVQGHVPQPVVRLPVAPQRLHVLLPGLAESASARRACESWSAATRASWAVRSSVDLAGGLDGQT